MRVTCSDGRRACDRCRRRRPCRDDLRGAIRGAPAPAVSRWRAPHRREILVSGGSRCNVTNRVVTERDFWGGSSRVVRACCAHSPPMDAAAFFEEIGVALHEEEHGKLFPDSQPCANRPRRSARRGERDGAAIDCGERVRDVRQTADGFVAATESNREYRARGSSWRRAGGPCRRRAATAADTRSRVDSGTDT